MIPPEDLKNKNFSRTVRGYNPIEVDDYIQFLMAKYEQLHRENAELEKRLHIVSGKYEELANDEESIRKAVSQAQKLSESMILAAERKADEITEKVKVRCENIIEDAQIKVEAEQIKLSELRLSAAQFKQMLLNEYTGYLKSLRETDIPSPEEAQAEFPSRDQILTQAMDALIPDESIEEAVIATTDNPELEDFKRFVRPSKKHMTREEKEAVKRARREGKRTLGQLTDEILQSSVDDEESTEDDSEDDLLAEAYEMSVEDAVSGENDTDFASDSNKKDNKE